MNRFVQQNGNVYWQDADGAMHVINPGKVSQTGTSLDYSGFKEFLGADGDVLERGMFQLWFIYINDHTDCLRLHYRSIIALSICATVHIELPDGAKRITCTTCEDCEDMHPDIFEEVDPNYFVTCDTIRRMQTELIRSAAREAQLEAENTHLREENTELRFRPGGPGYDDAAEHFAALALQ